MDKAVLAIPLIQKLEEPGGDKKSYHIIIDPNLYYHKGREEAKDGVRKLILKVLGNDSATLKQWGVDEGKTKYSTQYLFARLTGKQLVKLLRLDNAQADEEAFRTEEVLKPTSVRAKKDSSKYKLLYKIWNDFEVKALLTKSVSTIKADAARAAFAAAGKKITWAVMDSGIDSTHPHFKEHRNLNIESPLVHMDFTGAKTQNLELKDVMDPFGHGTHVAGIIAGEIHQDREKVNVVTRQRDEAGDVNYISEPLSAIAGIAPQCRLVSLRVLDESGNGMVSNLIAAIGYVQEVNGNGRMLRIQGVNMSVGYEFEPEWFACGQSPLCVEIDRLVRSGVVVVVAAGNTGYGFAQTKFNGVVSSGLDLTINDPGNAELAITVGSTHKEMPHIYGVSYFSSKGPTGDGRLKPDVVAPGEKIISCAAGQERDEVIVKMKAAQPHAKEEPQCFYHEDSGTSMSAAHVSGAVAAFLSIRREFIGQPERVKEIFLKTATDLNRARYFQGFGLIDLMRAIQSV